MDELYYTLCASLARITFGAHEACCVRVHDFPFVAIRPRQDHIKYGYLGSPAFLIWRKERDFNPRYPLG